MNLRWHNQIDASAVILEDCSVGSPGGEMRNKARGGSKADGCETPTSSARRRDVIARRAAILLGGTAAMALSIAQPASAIVINDQVAAAAGGIANYWDQNNQFPNVVSLFASGPETGSSCTSSSIPARSSLRRIAWIRIGSGARPYRSTPGPPLVLPSPVSSGVRIGSTPSMTSPSSPSPNP
jgi:hypothetical protein